MTQDVTLESELWTFDEVEWHETAQDTTTIKYVLVQVRPAVAKLRERVAKVATEETEPQQVRAWKLFLSLDKMLFHTSDAKRTNNTSLTNQDPYCADRGRKRTRNTETIPTNVRPPKDHETKNRPHGRHGQTQPKDDSTHRVSSGRRGRSESRQGGQGHQQNGPRCRCQGKLVQTLSRAQKRRPATPRPSTSPKKTSSASSASSCSLSNSLPPAGPRDLVVEGTSIERG